MTHYKPEWQAASHTPACSSKGALMTVTTDLGPVLRKVLEAHDAGEHLERYFREPGRGALAAGTYTGLLFEHQFWVGDGPEVGNRITG